MLTGSGEEDHGPQSSRVMGGTTSYFARDGSVHCIRNQRRSACEAERKIKLIYRSRQPGDSSRQGELLRPVQQSPVKTPMKTPAERKQKPKWLQRKESRDKEDQRYA